MVKTRTPRSAASFAAICGSTPRLFEPSVSTTITSSATPCLPGVFAPVGATDGSAWAMASSEVTMPWPMAVPNEVVRPLIALSSCFESVLGGERTVAVAAKATRPMRGPPVSDLTKALVARSAAVIRFGLTSVEHMEPDTSRASMIVADDDATGTVACGRAAPIASTARPAVSSATGMRRRQRERPGTAVRTSAIDVTRTTECLRLRRVSHQAPETSGMTRSASSAHGQENDTQTTRPVRITVSTAPAASSARAAAINAPASGSGSLVTVSLRLMDEAIPSSSLASDAGW